MSNNFLLLCIFFCCTFFITGCSHSISKDELKNKHNLIVIPYKGIPIKVEAKFAGTANAVDVIAGVILQAATSDARLADANYLNSISGSWYPSVATAEECLKTLQKMSNIQITSSSISDISVLPGYDERNPEWQKTFSHKDESGDWSWNSIFRNFRSSNDSLIKYKTAHTAVDADWALELYNFSNGFKNDEIYIGLVVKLSNVETNEILATNWMFAKWYDIPELNDKIDFKVFDKDFRDVAQKACSKMLSGMGFF